MSRLRVRRTIHGCVAILLIAVGAGAGNAAAGSQEALWMVRTYRIPIGWRGPAEAAPLDYWRLDEQGCWRAATAEEFFAEVSCQPTVVHTHGGHTDDAWATRQGRALMGTLRRWSGDRPVRVVLWKWPAERGPQRLRPDLRAAAARAEFEGRLLAGWLRLLGGEAAVTLVGYSFGGRTIAAGLHHLATEQKEESAPPLPRLSAVLVAAAFDSDALLPGRRYGKALTAVDAMLITHHRADRVLRLYPLLEPGPSAEALGFTGPACPWLLGPARKHLEVLDLTGCISGQHDFPHFLGASPLAMRLVHLTFGERARAATDPAVDEPIAGAAPLAGPLLSPQPP